MINTDSIKEFLADKWSVDFSNSDQTLWSHEDDAGEAYVFQVTPAALHNGVDVKIIRSFMLGPERHASVDIDVSGEVLESLDLKHLAYNDGSRGNVENWRDAISAEVGGDVQFIWHNVFEGDCAFIAKTVKVGTPERYIAGTSKIVENRYVTDVQFDEPVSEVLAPKEVEQALKM
jgi:hypothetical protein